MRFPNVQSQYFPLGGGLDIETPPIALDPGRVIDSQNYEPDIGGGYRRIDGYERFDGRTSPSAKSYWILNYTLTGTIAVGNTVTGATSAATGVVLAVETGYLVLGSVTGTFVSGETLTNGPTIGASTSAALENGGLTPSNHSDYSLLAANAQRLLIQTVPGSGQIRGIAVLNDIVYAFRDNAGGTAGAIYKATSSGWTAVSLGVELQFDAGSGEIFVGNTLTGATSGATGVVTAILLRTGTWGGTGVGTVVFASVTGTFQNNENLQVGGLTKAVADGANSAITRAAGGRVETFNYNFTGTASTQKMYGADGVNKAWEFDGTTYVPIRTGMTVDTPSHVIVHKGYLILSFNASVQLSGLTLPYSWTVLTGATEINAGTVVTGFLIQSGNDAGASLAIFTTTKTLILYGSSTSDFRLTPSASDLGYLPYTMQQVGNTAFGMTYRGIQSLITTLTYGDYQYAAISQQIQSLISRKRGTECASVTLREKNQYRIYYTDNTAIAVGLTGDKVTGMLPLNYSIPVRCIISATLSTGAEVTYFGSDDGYVYQDNIGTSFDGDAIEHYMRLPFCNTGSPLMRKRWRRAVIELSVVNYTELNITYDMGYGTPDISPAGQTPEQELIGPGGYWDSFTWDSFTWDAQTVANPTLSIDGTEKNLSLIFYGNRAQDSSHTISGVTLIFTKRRMDR